MVYIFYLVKETQMNSVISIDWKDFFKTGSIIFLAIQLIKSNWVLIIILSSLKFIVAVITWERGHFNWNSAFSPGFAPKIWKENNGKGVIDFFFFFFKFIYKLLQRRDLDKHDILITELLFLSISNSFFGQITVVNMS